MIRIATVLFGIAVGAGADAAQPRSTYVPGAGGVPLATSGIGPPDAPGILFLHGLGHGRDSFSAQFASQLAEKYHVVAFDLRGHGMSGKPSQAADYRDAAIWAEDVARVMAATRINRPVVVAWSYGSLVAADVVRIKGAQQISGLVFVSALGGLVEQAAQGDVPDDLVRARTLQTNPSLADQREASRLVAQYLTAAAAPASWLEATLTLNLMVPPYVQPLLRRHAANNRDLVDQFTMPVMIVHGAKDAALPQAAVDALVQRLPKAKASRYDNAGHAPFIEDPARFNRELADFAETTRSPP